MVSSHLFVRGNLGFLGHTWILKVLRDDYPEIIKCDPFNMLQIVCGSFEGDKPCKTRALIGWCHIMTPVISRYKWFLCVVYFVCPPRSLKR